MTMFEVGAIMQNMFVVIWFFHVMDPVHLFLKKGVIYTMALPLI
jgi:hypothetical protein